MHQIRGRFGGASDASNMFLGTALSNNFHDDSHFAKTESWIEQAIALGNSPVVNYIVEPQFGTIPGYIATRIASSGKSPTWKTAMTNWCQQATPSQYKTTVIHYYIDKKLVPRRGGPGTETLNAAVGA
jgi:hypothetical protein